MKISSIGGYSAVFGRRPKKHEEKEIAQLEKQAARELGTDTTGVIFFDTSIPKQKHDPGIGTSFSKDAQKQA